MSRVDTRFRVVLLFIATGFIDATDTSRDAKESP
jgi:hypothetical protein